MSPTNADNMRIILLRAADGSEAGVAAAAALMVEDARVWQQGAGWVDKPQKIAGWRRALGAPMATKIHSLVAEGDQVAAEATVSTPSGAILVTVFATLRDGRLATAREYFVPAPPAGVFTG